MSQYSEILDRITIDFLNRPELRTEAARAVRAAIRQHEAKHWWFNETSTALTTSAGQTFVSPPSNMLSFDRLEFTQNSADTKLVQTDFADLREMRASRPSGVPTHWTYYQDRFELAAIPDSAYSLPLYYLKSLATLSADTDSNEWTTFGENLIVHTAALDILTGVLDGSDEKVARHDAQAAAGLRELNQHNAQRLLRRIKPTKF